jgi:hypothetical protein
MIAMNVKEIYGKNCVVFGVCTMVKATIGRLPKNNRDEGKVERRTCSVSTNDRTRLYGNYRIKYSHGLIVVSLARSRIVPRFYGPRKMFKVMNEV